MGDVFSKSGLLTILFAGGVCLLLIFINGSLLAMIMSATFGLGVLLQIGIFAVVFRLQPTPKFEQKPLPI